MSEQTNDHAFIHDTLAAYLAGGLDPADRARFDAHINTCPPCFDAFTEARDADRTLQRTLGTLIPSGGSQFESRLVTHFREKSMPRTLKHAFIRRSAYAAAACVALAATGVFANYAIHQNGRFNNPLSQTLVAQADSTNAEFANAALQIKLIQSISEGDDKRMAAQNIRGRLQSSNIYGRDDGTQYPTTQTSRWWNDSSDASADTKWPIRDSLGVTYEARNSESDASAFNDGISARTETSDQPVTGRHVLQSETARVNTLMSDADKLVQGAKYTEAADLLKKATTIDPQNDKAKLMERLVQDRLNARSYEDLTHRQGQETARQNIDSAEHLIPYADLMIYPDNWLEVTRAREVQSSAGGGGRGSGGGGGGGGRGGAGSTAGGFGSAAGPTMPNTPAHTGPANSPGVVGLLYTHDESGKSEAKADAPVVGYGDAHAEFEKNSTAFLTSPDNIFDGPAPVNGTLLAGNVSGLSTFSGGKNVGGGVLTQSNGLVEVTDSNTAKYKAGAGVSTGLGLVGQLEAQKDTVASHGSAPTFTTRDDAAKASGATGSYDLPMAPVATDGRSHESTPDSQLASATTGHPITRGTPFTAPIATTTLPAQSPAPGTAPAPPSTLKIIRNGTVEFEVRSFDDSYLTVSTVVTEERGFVSSTSSEKLANGKVRGSIVVRVPPENLDRFLLKIRALGDLKAQQIGASDVTKQYTDIESELRGLRTMESRLIDLIKNGKGEVKDLVIAEKQLGDYRIRIETLEGEIRYYNNLVGMATLTITAYEKDIQKPTAAAEQENVNLSIETEKVESKYAAARKILEDAKGRIVESQLKNADADHVAATITADVPPEKSDFVAAQLKQLGRIASFNRDRRQTTTGGPGAPSPDVKVEQKDTRFSISLFNLANLAPRETTVMNIAVRDVEATYKKIQALMRAESKAAPKPDPDPAAAPDGTKIARPTARIINSNMAGQVPEQMTADLRAEIRAEDADTLIQTIRDSGEVITSTLSENPDPANTTAAKRGIQLRLLNIAAIPPKETVVMNIAVRDVESTQKKILALLQKPLDVAPTTPDRGPNAPKPETAGRILTNSINGQQPEQMTADLSAQIRADQADAILQTIRDSGEVLTTSTAQNPDPVNFTASKRGLTLRLINVAAVAARETQALRIVAADVPDAYKRLLASLQNLSAEGNARVISSLLNQSDPRTVNASMTFEARRDSLPAVEKAFADAGIDFLSRNIARSTNTAATLDTKIFFQIDGLVSADSLDARRTIILGLEVDNVDKAMDAIRSSISGTPVKETDFNASKAANGRTIENITLDSPVANTLGILTRIRDLGGTERENQVTKNAQVPDTKFAKDRIQLTLVSRQAIVQSDKDFSSTVRAALSSAAGALLYSLYLVVTGVLFIAPFAIIAWILYRMFRRKSTAA